MVCECISVRLKKRKIKKVGDFSGGPGVKIFCTPTGGDTGSIPSWGLFRGPPSLARAPSSPKSPPPGAGDCCSPSVSEVSAAAFLVLGCRLENVKTRRGCPGVARLPPQTRHQAVVGRQGRRSPLACWPAGAPSLGGSQGSISALSSPHLGAPHPFIPS